MKNFIQTVVVVALFFGHAFGQDLIITTSVCNPATSVRLTGPWWSWNPTGGPDAVDNGNGTWTFTLSPAPSGNMEYLLVVDGVQENLISAMQNGGTCAPVTDYANYANRQWLTTDPLSITNTYGQCTACASGGGGSQMDLPVTFDDPSVDYGLSGFGGAENSTIVSENGNASNKVGKVVKSATANTWAGTTITAAAQLGFATPIPFDKTKEIKVRVFSPDAGIPVRLKFEDHGNNTHTVETEAMVTVANQWDTLTFNFTNPAQGTAALNSSFVYDKASIFFNFGTDGVAAGGEKTYYFDDVVLGDTTAPVTDELNISVEVCKPNATLVRLTGPWWNWDPAGGPVATDQGNGVWKFTLSPKPTSNMEYLIVVDGVQENLIADMQNGGSCAPVTDYSKYANRRWDVGSGDVSISYDRCVPCSYPDLSVTVEVCDAANQVNLTGSIWSWNPAWGPQGVNNGNGTWTITLSPVPNDTLEYLIVKNGVTENLIADMQSGGGCAPITDYSSYANRRWIAGQGNVSITYDQCGACLSNAVSTLDAVNMSLVPNPTTSQLNIQSDEMIESVEVHSLRGEQIMTTSTVNQLNYQLDLTQCQVGIYLVQIHTAYGSQVYRVVKN